MALPSPHTDSSEAYVGTIVGESTSRDFRLAIAAERLREQDIIAVDAELRRPEDGSVEEIRIWAKVQRIERLNPLFPSEAGHELAATRTNPFDTVLSLSREMVTAVCTVLGSESRQSGGNRLDQLRYPARPASTAYRPSSADLARVVLGELQQHAGRGVDIATLANRSDVTVCVDGHAIVTRHLAILAMTGAGKSWAARRIIEQLAEKRYPIVIFDPHGDYTGLAEVPSLSNAVRRYYARFPLFNEDSETVADIVNALGYPLSDTMRGRFSDLYDAARHFYVEDAQEKRARENWINTKIDTSQSGASSIRPDMWLVAHLAEAGERLLRNKDTEGQRLIAEWGWSKLASYSTTDMRTLEAIKKRTYRAAKVLQQMEKTSQKIAGEAAPLPAQRQELVQYGQISVVSLAGYSSDFQAMIYSIIAGELFEARVSGDLSLPVLLLLEEAHNFAPARGTTAAENRSTTITRQIAQEGRKFRVGVILVSQRPSRVDETTLSQCNSFVIMRMVNPADQQYVRKVIETLGEDEARMLPDLDVGEALLSGQFTSLPVLVKIKPPTSKGEREEVDAFEELERLQGRALPAR